jgi:hypothetical protein
MGLVHTLIAKWLCMHDILQFYQSRYPTTIHNYNIKQEIQWQW